jgi:hypothetical protein
MKTVISALITAVIAVGAVALLNRTTFGRTILNG